LQDGHVDARVIGSEKAAEAGASATGGAKTGVRGVVMRLNTPTAMPRYPACTFLRRQQAP